MENSTRQMHGAKVLFWYLGLFFTLGIIAFATGGVWYQLINKLVPLEIQPRGVGPAFSQNGIIAALASIIVAAPIFYIFATAIRKSIKKNELTLDRGVRQWVSYLILFIVVATAIGDVIAFLIHVLSGDYTLRFVLKTAVILVITSWIFYYFWSDLRSDTGLSTSKLPRTMGVTTIVVLIATIVLGFWVADSPAVARAKALDNQRINDIVEVQGQVQEYYRINSALPASLDELTETGYAGSNFAKDPVSGETYQYNVVSDTEFEVCAEFTTDNTQDSENEYRYYGRYGKAYYHGAETACFTESVEQLDKMAPDLRVAPIN